MSQHQINVKLDPAVYEVLRERAAQFGQPISIYARVVLERALAGRAYDAEARGYKDGMLRAIGQIRAWLNE